jgi:cystathionine beta-synthase
MIQTNDKEAFVTARRLIREEGLFCGGSSGAIVFGALQVAKRLGPGKTVITVLTDSGSRYISKFLNDAWMKDHGFSNTGNELGSVYDLMQTQNQALLTARVNETVKDLIAKLKNNGISQMPIVDENNKPLAIVHEIDILHKLQAGDIRYESLAHEVAQPLKGVVSPNSSLMNLNKIFDQEQVAIVIDKEKLVGIISKIDMIEYMMRKMNG